jgi:VanZ family protein
MRITRSGLWLITGAYWLLLATATHLPPAKLPATHVSDKVEHFVAYLILAVLVYASLRKMRYRVGSALVIALVIALIYGAIDEQTQKLVGRDCSLRDWIADAGGAVAGGVVVSLAAPLAGRGARLAPHKRGR